MQSAITIIFFSEWGLCAGGLRYQFLVLRTGQKPQSHRCRQKPPPSISVCASLKWFSLLTHEHAWLAFGPLLVSVLFSPASDQAFMINGCSSYTGCHSIVDFLQYFFLYRSWLLIFLFHPLPQLPNIPHVL